MAHKPWPGVERYLEQQYLENITGEKAAWNKLVQQRALECMATARSLTGYMDSVLDVGCRQGFALETFRDHNVLATGVDLVPKFVEDARAKGFKAVVANAENLPFENQEFSWVFHSHTLEHTYEIEKAVTEAYRVAEIGVFWVIPLEPVESFVNNTSHYWRFYDPIEWLNVLKCDEFTLVNFTASSISDMKAVFVRKEEN